VEQAEAIGAVVAEPRAAATAIAAVRAVEPVEEIGGGRPGAQRGRGYGQGHALNFAPQNRGGCR